MLLAVLIAITAWLLSLFLPWWIAFIPGFIFGAFLGRTGWLTFLWGFVGLGGLWLVQSLYIDLANHGLLMTRIAALFSLPAPSLVMVITVLIGGLIGGLTALTGYLFRKVITN